MPATALAALLRRDPLPRRAADAHALAELFQARFGRPAEVFAWAPGRVAFLGAHVDTAEGWVLPAAIDRGIWLAAARGATSRHRIGALDLRMELEVEPGALPPPLAARGTAGNRTPDWPDFPYAVAWALGEEGHEVPPIDALFEGDLPMGAGVSSSAALEVALLLAWDRLGGLGLDRRTMIRLGRAAENGYLGVRSGPMDQAACLLGEEGAALLLDCRSLDAQAIPFPPGTAIVVADSGVRRRLAATGFNDRRAEVAAATAFFAERVPGAVSLRDVSPPTLERFAGELPPALLRRARHVVEECSRVLAGAEDLRRGDLAAFGARITASHRSSRDLFEVSLPELDLLAETAAATPGCFGARLAGGGFGGVVTALVEAEAAKTVGAALVDAFAAAFARRPEVFIARIGPGAEVWP